MRHKKSSVSETKKSRYVRTHTLISSPPRAITSGSPACAGILVLRYENNNDNNNQSHENAVVHNDDRELALTCEGKVVVWWTPTSEHLPCNVSISCISIDQATSYSEDRIRTVTNDSMYACQRPVRTSESSKLESSLPSSWTVIVRDSGTFDRKKKLTFSLNIKLQSASRC